MIANAMEKAQAMKGSHNHYSLNMKENMQHSVAKGIDNRNMKSLSQFKNRRRGSDRLRLD